MPQYLLTVKEAGVFTSGGKEPVEVEVAITIGLSNIDAFTAKGSGIKQPQRTFDMTSVLTYSSDYDFIDYRRVQ